jgi:hypothetical protein
MIEFLQHEVRDRRFEYGFLNAYHPLYNEHAEVLSAETVLPVADHDVDIISMFSVITHQNQM